MSPSEPAADLQSPRGPSPWLGHVLALACVAAATALAVAVDAQLAIPNLSLVFVLPVVIAAIRFGWAPSMTAAVAGVFAYNYFLIAPRHSFHVAQPANVWALILLLAVAAAVSAVAAQSRRRAVEALRALDQASALQGLAKALVGARDERAIARACAEVLARLFRAPAVVFVEAEGALELRARAGEGRVGPADVEAARWVSAAGLATRGGEYPNDASDYDFWPVQTPQRRRAVLGVRISGRDEGRPDRPEQLVDAVAGYLAVALDREAYAREALESRIAVAAERMKSDLLAAVSHDLKTPLSTILAALQSLQRFGEAHDAQTRRELLTAAEAETSRLSAMVANLLDVNRIEAGALPVRLAPEAPDTLVERAVARAAYALADRRLVKEFSPNLAPLNVDGSLFEAALANVLENAGLYSPPGSTIRLRAGEDRQSGWIEVVDEGPGFAGAVEPLFDKFARGAAGDGRPAGTGLGLTIARGFLEAQGGRIGAANRKDRTGAVVRLIAPLAVREPARA